jgi:very-short-patch-repair endonuclease
MEHEMRTLVAELGGVFTAAEAQRSGLHRMALSRAVAAGAVVRIGRGVYAMATDPPRPPSVVYRLKVRGALRRRRNREREAATSLAGLALLDLPLFDVPLNRVDVVGDTEFMRKHGQLWLHPWPSGAVRQEVDGVGVLDAAHACVATAAAHGVVAGVVAMDAALHLGLTRLADLKSAATRLDASAGVAFARSAISLSDPKCESVGESRTRIILSRNDLEFEAQAAIWDGATFVARVDFLIEGKLVLEFDGAEKYGGADGRRALVAEKVREDRLRELGYRVLRVTWADLEDPWRLVQRIRAALAVAA